MRRWVLCRFGWHDWRFERVERMGRVRTESGEQNVYGVVCRCVRCGLESR